MDDPLYQYIEKAVHGKDSFVSGGMEGLIPLSLTDAIRLASTYRETRAGIETSIKEELASIFLKTTRNIGVLTERAKNSIERFLQGGLGIEIAHQPKFLGGEKFILNKLALGGKIASLHEHAFPFFYLADYDKVHPELVKVHFSLVNSGFGFSTSIEPSIEQSLTGTCISELPLPEPRYMRDIIDRILANYEFSINACTEDAIERKLLKERLEECTRLLKSAYYKANNYSDWFLNIIGTISNVYYDMGYIFIAASDPRFRKLLTPVYEHLVKEQPKYTAFYSDLFFEFTRHGLEPPLREIEPDFAPFFLECQGKTCFKNRIQPRLVASGSKTIISGR
nr:hypothetical protein [Candidatus Sigynarchaeota archaeon]